MTETQETERTDERTDDAQEPELDPRGLEDKPHLASGSAGPAVVQLADALHRLGYETSISRGENPYGVLDQSVMAAVRQFRSDEDAQEDASAFAGDQAQADAHIGPHTWAALRDALEKKKDE
jgi:peptidoglycan hydrolase-like protein with peptidoglycan-binding domain